MPGRLINYLTFKARTSQCEKLVLVFDIGLIDWTLCGFYKKAKLASPPFYQISIPFQNPFMF